MITENTPPHMNYREQLLAVFCHDITEVSVFSAESFPPALLAVFLSLVVEGRSLGEMESDYFEVSEHDPLSLLGMTNQISRHHLKVFAMGMKALLAHKDHYCKAIDYLTANAKLYKEGSKGLFDQPNRKLKRIPLVSSFPDLPNYCRQADGSLRSAPAISQMVRSPSDSDVLILSAIVNRDSEAVSLLTKCLESDKVYGILKSQLKNCPDMGLEDAFGHILAKRTHVIYSAEMSQLMGSDQSTYEDYEKTFWPEASSIANDTLVSAALGFSFDSAPSKVNMLKMFRDKGVDLYPGMILVNKGQPAYLDAIAEAPDLFIKQQAFMDFVVSRDAMGSTQDFSVLLRDIPLDRINAHKSGQDLLKHLYLGTRDARILPAIEDKKFRGKMLEDSLGM
jgi:hypothetical protein